ncbi:nucleotide exchange factor GrpE [bacterium]|nr:nucleotide exchange factor GrpE [bacterium]
MSKKTNVQQQVPVSDAIAGQVISDDPAASPSLPVEDNLTAALDDSNSDATLAALQAEVDALKEKAARAVADYQNLQRRQQEEQSRVVDYARITIFSSLLQPLEHLSLAAKALQDQGLDMVVKQFWTVLGEQGLEEISPLNQPFDANCMEAIQKVGEGNTVKEVLSPGYRLGKHVIQVAKVKVG